MNAINFFQMIMKSLYEKQKLVARLRVTSENKGYLYQYRKNETIHNKTKVNGTTKIK
jgi:hypothetical protein